MHDSLYPLQLQEYRTPPQQVSGCPLPLLRPSSLGQGLTPPPEPGTCPAPPFPSSSHCGSSIQARPERVQGQTSPPATGPHGSAWSEAVSNISLIGPGACGAEVGDPERSDGPDPHPARWAGSLQLPFHRYTVRWHPPTPVLVQLPWGVGLDQALHRDKGLWEGLAGPEAQWPRPGKGLRLHKPAGGGRGAVPSPSPSPPHCGHPRRWRSLAPPGPAAKPRAHTLPQPGLLAHATLFTGRPPVMGSPAWAPTKRGGGRGAGLASRARPRPAPSAGAWRPPRPRPERSSPVGENWPPRASHRGG